MIDTCIICGEYIPEGRMICKNCENNITQRINFLGKSKSNIFFPKVCWGKNCKHFHIYYLRNEEIVYSCDLIGGYYSDTENYHEEYICPEINKNT